MEWKILAISIVAVFGGVLLGIEWSEISTIPKIKRLEDEVNFYRSRNHYVYRPKEEEGWN